MPTMRRDACSRSRFLDQRSSVIGKVWRMPGQGLEEGNDLPDGRRIQVLAELILRHRAHRLFERGGGAIVKLRRGQLDVPQTRHAKHEPVSLEMSDIETPVVGFHDVPTILEVFAHHAEALEHVAPDVAPLVTRHAADGLEPFVSRHFDLIQCVLVASQPRVEANVRRIECALEARNGRAHVCFRHPVGESGLETAAVRSP